MTEEKKVVPPALVMIAEGYIQSKYARFGKTTSGKYYYSASISVYDGKDEGGNAKRAFIGFTVWDDPQAEERYADQKARITGKPRINRYTSKKTGEEVVNLEFQWCEVEILPKYEGGEVKAPVTQQQIDSIGDVSAYSDAPFEDDDDTF